MFPRIGVALDDYLASAHRAIAAEGSCTVVCSLDRRRWNLPQEERRKEMFCTFIADLIDRFPHYFVEHEDLRMPHTDLPMAWMEIVSVEGFREILAYQGIMYADLLLQWDVV